MRPVTRTVPGARRQIPFLVVALLCLVCTPAASAAALNPVVGSPFATGASSDPFSVAFSPSGALLASANDVDGTVSVMSVSATGALAPVAGSPISVGVSPTTVAFSPSGTLLAVANYFDSTVSMFTVSAAGGLTPVAGSPFTTGNNPWSLAFGPGDRLATANFSDNTVSMFSVSAAGVLTQVAGSPFPVGAGPTSVAFSPGGLLAAANFTDSTISVASVSAAGALSPVAGSPFATGALPFSVAFSPTGTQLATANSGDGTLSMFSASAAGALAPVAGSPFTTGGSPAAVAFRPGGGLIASGDSGSGTLSVFLLSPTGALTTADGSPFTTGSFRFTLAFSPSGGFLAAPSHNATGAGTVSMFSVALGPDTTAPVVSCAAASAAWLAANAAIRCTASDPGSGLANPAQASFTLTTNVAAGAESANASTNSVSVCDVAGNCRAAGPVAGNKIDRKLPTITLTRPAQGASYSTLGTLLNPVRASYSCADTGSAIASCTGSRPNGAVVDAGLFSLGSHTFTVTARDQAGNTATKSNTYSVRLL
jgi:DNA-binding beta-propeller fold protein YncE